MGSSASSVGAAEIGAGVVGSDVGGSVAMALVLVWISVPSSVLDGVSSIVTLDVSYPTVVVVVSRTAWRRR